MTARSDLAELLVSLECALLLPDVRRSDRVSELLAESYFEFGSSGRRLERATILRNLAQAPDEPVEASGFSVQLLSDDVALVTYQSLRLVDPPVRALRSSIWRRSDGSWRMVFHQGTRMPPESRGTP